ncbi:MAG: hypothetical protein V3S69_05470, partial [Dehalococcoidales bacterium]
PRHITNNLGSRYATVHYINTYIHEPKMHLLGMSKHLDDDLKCTKESNVIGIDSANPLVLGYHGRLINGHGQPAHVERLDYWDTTMLTELMEYNVEWTHSVVGGL